MDNSQLRPACELLALLNLADSTRGVDHEHRIKELLPVVSRKLLLDVARRNSAFVLTDRGLRSRGAPPPDDFASAARKIQEAGGKRAEWIQRILSAAASSGIEVIVLKGALLGSVVYGDPGYKKMNDMDVLVRPEQAEPFAELLRRHSFLSVGNLLGEREISDKSHHAPPFVSPDLACVVGLHWGLCSPHAVWKPDLTSVWTRKASANVCGSAAFRMSWEHLLLHLCTHLPFYKVGVRELADVYNAVLFAEKENSFDWAFFASQVQRWKASDAVYRVLSLAQALIPFGVPESLLSEWRKGASSFTRGDTEMRLRLEHSLVATRSVHIGKIEKAFSVFRLSPNYRERVGAWAMTWVWTFYPPRREVPFLLGRVQSGGFIQNFTDRCRVVDRSWRAMARDYGNFPLCLITWINILQVIRDTILYPFRKNGPGIHEHPAARLLELLE